MELQDELERVAAAASALAGPNETLESVIPTEPAPGARVYLCAYSGPLRTWAAVDAGGRVVTERARVRAAVSIAALCELAEESAAGGKLEELRQQLVALRITEHPEGIQEAEDAALALERTIEPPPRLASPAYLDAVGVAVRRLELALGESMSSPFGETMKHASAVVDELELDVEAGYKADLT
ncbi:MAG: hypothetical protein ACM3QU_15170 [Verrucomicrobiota bacterium]